jgi:hypothetical protein
MSNLPKEVQDEIQEMAAKFHSFSHEVLVTNFRDLDLYILKCHLIIEHQLDKSIETVTKNRLSMDTANFTFSQKIKLAMLLGFFDENERMKIFLTKLNKLRNHIAHKLTYDPSLLREITDFENNYNEEKFETQENYYKTVLFYLVSYYCGALPFIARIIPVNISIEVMKDNISEDKSSEN